MISALNSSAPRTRRAGPCPGARRMPLALLAASLLLTLLLSGCQPDGPPATGNTPSSGASGSPSLPLPVLATTGMIADTATRIGGERVQVTALMGPGVDPHLYQPTARDQGRLRAARVILYNGLHLEGKMVQTFETLAREKQVVAVSRDIPPDRLLGWGDSHELHDPHIWFDVTLWQQAARTIATALSEADPAGQPEYDQRLQAYLQELAELDAYCRRRAAEVPEPQRVLVTSHDAFHYFGRAYGFEVYGIQGISTDTEAGLKALTDAIDLIRARQLRAIFPETSVPRTAIERVARDSGARLGHELYSDALGNPDTPAGTYTGMIRANIDTIVNALTTQ